MGNRQSILAISIAIILSLLSAYVAEAALTQAQKIADFRELVTLVEQNYAPLRWKQKSVGLDWPTHVDTYRDLVKRSVSDMEFYQTLTKFLVGLQDAHVSVNIPSTHVSDLGFLCDYLGGKVLLEEINLLQLPAAIFPFDKGDQLIAIDGRPVADIMEDFLKLSATGYDLSARRLAAINLTYRRQSRGFPTAPGISTVTILPKGESEPKTVSIAWKVRGRAILEMSDANFVLHFVDPIYPSDLKSEIASLSLGRMSLPQDRLSDFREAGLNTIGSDASMFTLPEGAVVNPDVPFTAAVYRQQGKNIGVLRIPEYGDENFVSAFAKALAQMQGQVDVLVIDQTNNPGGSVSTVSTIFSFFTDRSALDAKFAVRPSMRWLEKFSKINVKIDALLEDNPDNPLANAYRQRFRYLENLMVNSLEQNTFLTEPFSLDLTGSLGMVQPNSTVRFTKPVLLLINEFDFSGGDVFPALMRDSGRATLFGHRTTGAGGNVGEYGPLTNSYFKFSLTESLVVRPNGKFIENLGVEPQIAYEITEKDFLDGYKDYVRAFTCAALKLVQTDCNAPE